MTAQLLQSWRELLALASSFPPVDAESAFRAMLESLAVKCQSQDAFAVIARRTDEEQWAELSGWKPARVFFLSPPDRALLKLVDVWLSQPALSTSDPFTRTNAALSDGPRALLRQDALGSGETWHDQPTYQFLKARGMRDRMVGGTPLGRDIQLYVGLDRSSEGEDFSPDDRDALAQAMELFVPVGRNLTLVYGLTSEGGALSGRRQEVLKEVLTGATEDEIASRLGASRHTIHGHIKDLYKHFEVSSRAQLLSLWLSPWD